MNIISKKRQRHGYIICRIIMT